MNQPPPDGVHYETIKALVDSYKQAGASSLEGAFPAALVAPVWRALLEADAVTLPGEVDAAGVEVRMLDADRIELVLPLGEGDPAIVSVHVTSTQSGDLERRVGAAARGLARAISESRRGETTDWELIPEQGQKMHG